MQRLLTIVVLTMLALSIHAAQQEDGSRRIRYKDGPAFIYRISLTDKAGTHYYTLQIFLLFFHSLISYAFILMYCFNAY